MIFSDLKKYKGVKEYLREVVIPSNYCIVTCSVGDVHYMAIEFNKMKDAMKFIRTIRLRHKEISCVLHYYAR